MHRRAPLNLNMSIRLCITLLLLGLCTFGSLSIAKAQIGTSFPAGKNLFSVPYTYPGRSLDNIFGYTGVNLSVWDPTDLVYNYTPTPPADQLRPGTGYWVNFPSAINLTGGVLPDQSKNATIHLQLGWNQVGDPFTYAVPLSAVQFNGETFAKASVAPGQLVDVQLYSWNNTTGAYVTTTTLTPGAGYQFYAMSNVSMLVPAPLPTAPSGLSAVGATSSVTLSWQPSPNGTSYEVHMGTSAGAESPTPAATVTGASATISGLTTGTHYYFTVIAVNANGKSAASNEVSAVPGTITPPATYLSAIAGDTTANLTWSTASAATTYSIFEGTSSHNEGPAAVATTAGRSATISNLVDGTTYYFTVSYVTATGTSLISNEVVVTPGIAPPANLAAVPGIAQASLSWPVVTGVSTYHVKRTTTSGSGYSTVASVTGTSYVDATASNGITYYYVVTSVSAANIEGRNSVERSATPEPAPTGFATTPGAGGAEPWERSVDGVNLVNGNLLTVVPVVSWTARGGIRVDVSLIHNSETSVTSEVGPKWNTSYDESLSVNSTGDVTVTQSDGKQLLFQQHQGSGWGEQFMPPPGVYEALQTASGGYDLTSRDGTTHQRMTSHFSQIGSQWLLTKVSDMDGNIVTVNHNSAGQVSSVVDPTSRTAVFTYNANNQLSTISDPIGRTWTMSYDSNSNVSAVAWPSVVEGTQTYNASLSLTYTATHDIATYIDLGGSTRSYSYFSGDSVASETDAVGNATSFCYSLSGSQALTNVVDPNGNGTQYTFQDGATTLVTDPFGFQEEYFYTDLPDFTGSTGNPSYPPSYTSQSYDVSGMIDKDGYGWNYLYDNQGDVVSQQEGNPTSTTPVTTTVHMIVLVGVAGAPNVFTGSQYITTTREDGSQVTDTYNANDRLISHQIPAGLETYQINSNGLRSGLTDALSHHTTYGYNTNGYQNSITDANNNVSTSTYNTLGWKLTQQDALGNVTQYVYDNWGRAITVIAPDLTRTNTVYDLNGNVITVSDANNNTVTNSFDAGGRKTTSVSALGYVLSNSFDGFGQKGLESSCTDGDGNTTRFGYTARNEKSTTIHPDGTIETTYFSPGGLPVECDKQDGTRIDMTYDAFKKLLVRSANGTVDTTYAYDTVHRRSSMVDQTGTTTWTYDTSDRTTGTTSPSGSVTYTYDAASRKLTMANAGIGTWTYGYDNGNRLTSVSNPYSENTTFIYDNANRMTKQTDASGMIDTVTYDVNSRIKSVSYTTSGSAVLGSYSYSYDPGGRETQRNDNDGSTTTFGYDSDNKLTSEVRTGYQPSSVSYTYDQAENRLTKNLNGAVDNYVYVANELASVTGSDNAVLGYDINGNLVSSLWNGINKTYLYDSYNQMTRSVTSSLTDTYAYNGLGLRVAITDSQGTRTYLTNGCDPASPVISDQLAVYTPGISERRSSATSYYLLDAQGTTRALANGSQAITNTYVNDAFGRLVTKTGTSPTPFVYVGKSDYQTDGDTGYLLLGQRYYSPEMGRFLTQDPSGQKDDLNLYAYCKDNPIAATDPEGLWTLFSGSWLEGEAGIIGFGAGYGVSIDQNGTLSFWGSGQFQVGFGVSAEAGKELGVSPGNSYVGKQGVGASAYMQPGVGVAGGDKLAAEIQQVFGRPTKNSFIGKHFGWLWQSTPGASISPSTSGSLGGGEGLSIFVLENATGNVSVNIPTVAKQMWNQAQSFYQQLMHTQGAPFSGTY